MSTSVSRFLDPPPSTLISWRIKGFAGVINTILTKIIGTKNERELKAIRPTIQRINELEPSILPLTEAELRAKTEEFRRRLKGGDGDGGGGESLDQLLPEAFAVVREAGRRVLGISTSSSSAAWPCTEARSRR